MKFIDNRIEIIDWAGNTLYIGPCDAPEADDVLKTNKCKCHEGCEKCDGTGYLGDFEVKWVDSSDKENHNVYEYINY